jgi:hypothetical protein
MISSLRNDPGRFSWTLCGPNTFSRGSALRMNCALFACSLACALSFALVQGQTVAEPKPVLAEDVFKNVQVPGTMVSSSRAPAATVFPSPLIATQQPIESCRSPSFAFK